MNPKRICFVFILFAAVVGVAATAPSSFADHATAEVSIPSDTSVPGCQETDECWLPSTVTIDVGGEITWSNDDTAAHTVTSGTTTDGPDGNFDSGLFVAGNTFSVKFDDFDPAEYPYYCMVHPWMVGTVIVQEAEAEEEELMVSINTEPVGQGEMMTIEVEFMYIEGNPTERVNYNIIATQGDSTVLDEQGVHDLDGKMSHTTMALPAAASDDSPVDVEVEFLGFGIDPPFTGPIGHVEEAQVVPEFGTIATMVLGVAVISIIAVTARSKVFSRL